MKSFVYFAVFSALSFSLARAESPGAVYAQTNAAAGNSVVVLPRMGDGRLGSPSYIPTGGIGAGAGLGSQGAVTLTESGHWLLAVNAGSNDVTTFRVEPRGGLTVRSRVPSGGVRPISVTVRGDAVFVLNAGGTANISGFELTADGDLAPLAGAVANLQGTGPAQVQFDRRGDLLVVTDKTSNQIEVFRWREGRLRALYVAASAGTTPFGFDIGRRDVLVVSEAGSGSASSYELTDEGLFPISRAVSNTQRAACWLIITNDGRFAYVANAQSRSISSYAISRDGALRLVEAVAGSTPANTAPTDLALNQGGSELYSLATGTISVFRVGERGGLAARGVVTGLPATTTGLTAK